MSLIFQSFLLTSIVGTALAGILLILRPVTRRVFSAHWHYYIWLTVLLVMLFPVRFVLPEKVATPDTVISTVTENTTVSSGNQVISVSYTPISQDSETQTTPTPMLPANSIAILSYIWLTGAMAFFIIKAVSYFVFLKKVRKHSIKADCPELSSYTKRNVRVRVSNKIISPLITGVLSPTLLLPDINMDKVQLHNILSHEMMHLKRGDILYKWLMTLTKCVHWFNPAIYLISSRIDTDCEISCDLAVVKNMTNDEKNTYIETILSLLSHNNAKPTPLTTGMTGSKKTLKKRFIMIKNNKNFDKKSIIISVITAVIVLSGTILAGGILNGNFVGDIATDKQVSEDFNLLFVGVDKSERADTIMLIKCEESSIHGISIPRDTRIANLRISDIWASGGVQATIDALRLRLNQPIHYYAKLNLAGVSEIADALGGIDFYVPMDMEYSDPYQDLNIKLKEGYFTLNGECVKHLMQFRPGNSTHGDLSRIDIHQQFIRSFAKQKITAENLEKAQELFKLIAENLETNYPVHKLKSNTNLLTAVQNNNIHFETIQGFATTYNGMPVYEISDEISIVWPTDSMEISNGFGTRTHPITGQVQTHNGVDIKLSENAPVYSAIYGTVTEAGYDKKYGNYVVIENDGIKTFYGHLASIIVEKDAEVKEKSIIGSAGKTGQATGANLHFEIMQNGTYINPEEFLDSLKEYHQNIDHTIPTSVINGFFKAFESGDYNGMKRYCTEPCISSHFMKSDNGNIFNVFGMSMATLRSVSEPDYLKGDSFLGYSVNVSCKVPDSFSILKSKNSFRVFLEKQKDNTYKICDLSY